jgi:hypothetical protein
METKVTDNRNPYIEQGIIQDCDNDYHLVAQMRTLMHDAINFAKKHQDQGAMAYNDHFFEDMIEKLDDVLADTLAPVQDQIEQGLDYHGGA